MTQTEKAALLAAFAVAAKAVENSPIEGEEAISPIVPPRIGPMYDNVSISDRLNVLPFDNEEFEQAVLAMDEAIRTQNRVASGVDTVTMILGNVRQLLPLLLTL